MDGSIVTVPTTDLQVGDVLQLPMEAASVITTVKVGREYVNLTVRHRRMRLADKVVELSPPVKTRLSKFDDVLIRRGQP